MPVAPLTLLPAMLQKQKAAGYQRVTDCSMICTMSAIPLSAATSAVVAQSGHRLVEDVDPARQYTGIADNHRKLLSDKRTKPVALRMWIFLIARCWALRCARETALAYDLQR